MPRLIDANALKKKAAMHGHSVRPLVTAYHMCVSVNDIDDAPTIEAEVVKHGRWIFTVDEERCNYRWNVTAECSECHHSKGEIYAGFFPGVPSDIARDAILDSAKSVKMDNYCPNCGAKMDGGANHD